MPKAIRLGVDLGGTKLEIVALDAKGRERLRRRIATPQDGYEATLAAVAALVRDAERELGLAPDAASVGIGTPGSISRATGLLRGSNSVNLNGRAIREDLAPFAGPRRAHHERRELLCAVRSDAMARGKARPSSSASSSVRAWAPASSCTDACSTGRMRSPGSGDTIRCRGLVTTNGPVRAATADTRVASRRGCPVRAFEADHRRVTGIEPGRHRHRCARSGRRRQLRGDAGALRGPAGPVAGARDQRARPRRDRAGRRHVERRSTLRQRTAPVGRVGILGSRRHAPRPGTRTAIRAACAARRGCGPERATPSHAGIVGPAAAFRRDPVDVLARVLDVARLAMDAILRVDLKPLARRARRLRPRRIRRRPPGSSAARDRRRARGSRRPGSAALRNCR